MRVGVVGTGSMGKNHLRVIHSIPELTLTCAMDKNPQTLRDCCEPYDGLIMFDDYRNMTDHVDAVMVATPTISHYEITKFFLHNEKHVLVEKPFTTTLEQADELIAISEKMGVVLAVGHLERFNPAVEYIKPLVDKPLFVEIQRLGSFSPRSLDVDVIMDLMIHDLDILLQWAKDGIKHINASGIPIISDKTDIANVRLEFNNGMIANVTASRVSQKKTRKLRIFQKNNYLSIDYKKKRVKSYTIENGNIIEDIPTIQDIEPLYTLWKNFHKTISTGQNFNVTSKDARAALQLALQISNTIESHIDR